MSSDGPLYLGFDLSTQQLKAIVVDSDLKIIAQVKVDFDGDFGDKYGIKKGVHVRDSTGEVYAPVAMWMESLDLVLERLRDAMPVPMDRIKGVSGSGQQHGSVYWNDQAQGLLKGLDAGKPLAEQLAKALANEWSPNWQDQSTQSECDAFDSELGDREKLAQVTGSGAHHRFTGPQIMRQRRVNPDMYARTARISLVSSWLASVLMGDFAPLDVGDVCGMNLWDIPNQRYSEELLLLTAGGDKSAAAELRAKLGEPRMDGGGSMGTVSQYFVRKFGFSPDCQIAPFTGDNPATILALPLRPLDAIVSLGTSTTFLMNTPAYKPDGAYHFFNHPTTNGNYMFMLCYKNGGLAREKIRDELPKPEDGPGSTGWENFNKAVLDTPPLDVAKEGDRAKLGLYFQLRETVPNIRAGTFRFTCNPADGSDLRQESGAWSKEVDPRIIVESQALSMRLRSQNLVHPPDAERRLPAQPRRIYLVGGGSLNPAIARVIGDVLGGVDGVYKLDVGGSACALGGAYKALWAMERKDGETFDDLIGKRWKEEGSIQRVDQGFRDGTYQKYGNILGAFENMEKELLAQEAKDSNGSSK
ncbi:D-xylulose kinase A-like protein [Hapsidospora chrysogenum ATCC 11550]|uniref:Xylulose kinase n=1 Tax=Hapsidospora chrysogenum (strain ATCC 11550 / CBS 779.69 / DSM 880 / IAM 14645 / JCM 23072 / IMI 49137) TaxID=857340 RepID=A0A086T1L2_HAPC1|nr:D-xylulose kinase A-like protein [Hapsidospora chrysogenum ATCC 11550]